MNLTRAEIGFYSLVAAATFLALAKVIPWWIVAACLVPGAAIPLLEKRYPSWLGLPPAPRAAARIIARLLVPACIVVLAVVLDLLGAPAGVIVLLCGMAVGPYVYDRLQLLEADRHRRQLERNPHRPLGATLEDWTTFALSIVFCLIALLLLVLTPDWRTGVVTLAFFGACALILGTILVRKRRARQFRALRVSIEGSRDIPMSGVTLVPLALLLLMLGGVMYFVGTTYPPLFRGLGAFIAVVGALVIALRVCGLMRRQFLRFEPRGIVIGQIGFEFRIDWDNIEAMAPTELADNPTVLFTARDIRAIEVTPRSAGRKLARYVRQNQVLGADIVIMPWLYGLDAAPLIAALARYIGDPGSRSELAPRGVDAYTPLPAA